MADYATLAEVRTFGVWNSQDLGDDSVLEDLISRVSALIDTLTGRTFAPSVDETKYFPFCDIDGRDLWLGNLNNPLLSVTSLTNGDGTTIASSEYLLLPRGAQRFHTIRLKEMSEIDWTEDADGDSFVSVTGKFGWTLAIPDDVKQGTIESVVYIAKQRRTIESSERPQVSADGLLMLPSMLPKRMLAIIEHYKVRV